MNPWLRLLDALAEVAEGELKYRRENPGEWAKELRDREKMWESRGRAGLARVAGRRAKRWERRAKKMGV